MADADGKVGLTEREPFGFVDLTDNRYHVVAAGDTLFNLAARAFPSFPNPSELFWVIGDFQSPPITDATLDLTVGDTLIIPSERTVRERIFDETRRNDFEG